jgi:hypothetical protein
MEHPLSLHPSRLPAPSPHLDGLPVGQRIAEPWLRAQLPGAVLARPQDDLVDRAVWWLVAQCLEATAHAIACAQDGTDPSTVAVLATFAVDDTSAAVTALARTRSDRPAGPPQPAATARGTRLVPVERTWFRLAGLLAGPAPADPALLAVGLTDHRGALGRWREVLLGPARVRRAAPGLVVRA